MEASDQPLFSQNINDVDDSNSKYANETTEVGHIQGRAVSAASTAICPLIEFVKGAPNLAACGRRTSRHSSSTRRDEG